MRRFSSASRPPEQRLMPLVAGIVASNRELALCDIASQLDRLHERTPRSGNSWSASSVKNLLYRTTKARLIENSAPHRP